MDQVTRYRHVVEIGAGDRFSSQGWSWATHADKVTLYEPNTLLWGDLMRATAGMSNVQVQCQAVAGQTGVSQLIHLGYASYLAGHPSFLNLMIEPDGEQWYRSLMRGVVVAGIGDVDKGDWDYLILTNNGGEMAVLNGMRSRPKVIRTKHYMHNGKQVGYNQMMFNWLQGNGYGGQVLETNEHNTFYHLEWRRG